MEERCSVNSPRRVRNLSKNRKADVSFSDADDLSPTRFGVSGEHGPKLSEVYGFVGSITIVVATGIFIIWAYVPDHWLHSIGIYYHPSKSVQWNMCLPLRYWALAVPSYVMVTIVLAIGFYIGLNFMDTPPPTSLKSMFDEYSKEPQNGIPSTDDDYEVAIEPLSDKVNEMFDNLK